MALGDPIVDTGIRMTLKEMAESVERRVVDTERLSAYFDVLIVGLISLVDRGKGYDGGRNEQVI
jgi:hypothetical protein